MTPDDVFNTPLDPERINELSRSFWNSAILRAGIKLGVFALLDMGGLTAEQVAHRIKASPRYVQAFLDSCIVLGLLDKQGDIYVDSPLASQSLVPGKDKYVGDLVLHITNHWETWGRLDKLIREGKTVLPFETGYVDAATYWRDYMWGQHNRALAGQAEQLVKTVDMNNKRRMLDLGGGAASYSIALCQANPRLESVVIDRREPLAIARQVVEKAGLQKRVRLVEGDFFTADLGRDSDVALISGVMMILSEDECHRLLQRTYGALVPGGQIIIQDFMRLDPSPGRRLMDTLMDLYTLIAFDPSGGDRTGEEVARWVQEAGFGSVSMVPLPTHLAIITGEKSKG